MPSGPANSSSRQPWANKNFEWWVISQSNVYKLGTKPERPWTGVRLVCRNSSTFHWSFRSERNNQQQAPNHIRRASARGEGSSVEDLLRLDSMQLEAINYCWPFLFTCYVGCYMLQLTRQLITSSVIPHPHCLLMVFELLIKKEWIKTMKWKKRKSSFPVRRRHLVYPAVAHLKLISCILTCLELMLLRSELQRAWWEVILLLFGSTNVHGKTVSRSALLGDQLH